MKFTKVLLLVILTVAVGALLSACGSATPVPAQGALNATQPSKANGEGAAAASVPAAAPGSIVVNGGGATFPQPLYVRWLYDYAFVNTTAKFNYQGTGSGQGIKDITAKTLDFAGSDAILSADEQTAAPDLLMFPTVAGGVAVVYNVADTADQPIASGLKLDSAVLAGIFLGKITRWNAPEIVALNPDAKLPNADITVAHRSDGSGTTFVFTNYLAAVSEDWKSGPGAGKSVEWPVGLGGRGNPGVAGIVKDQPNTIGYLDLGDAISNKLPVAFIQNASGEFVEPKVDSIVAAEQSFADAMPEDMKQLIINSSAKDAYPITAYTFLLLYKDMPDCARASAITGWYRWALTQGSQDATSLNYAPLPQNVLEKVLARLTGLTCEGGNPIDGNQ